jgi:hypothetical protein
MRTLRSAAVVGLALLAGCAPSGAISTTTPTPVAEAGLPAVSLETTCDLLFGRDFASGPAPRSADIILRLAENPDGSTIDSDEVGEVLAELEGVAETALPELLPYLEAVIEPIATLDAIYSGTAANQDIDFTFFKAASTELLNRCT